MNFKHSALTISAALLLSFSPLQAAENAQEDAHAANTQAPAAEAEAKVPTLFDPSTWHDASGHVVPGEMIEFTPSNPKDWAKVIDPKTHTKVHMTVTNPEFYGKFMNPGHYMRFTKPETWMSYMDPATYMPIFKTAMDPKTMTYWMQPGAYLHAVQPEAYMQMFNPEAYAKLASNVTKELEVTSTEEDSADNIFNPFVWMKKFSDAATKVASNATSDAAKATQ